MTESPPALTYATARDGCKIAYRLHPAPGKPRLALAHSLALDGSFWDWVVAELKGEFEILAYDCRGHGKSDRRPGPYSTRLFADDLADLLDQCGWRDAYVAGCSMGGCVAQAFGAAYPDRARGLVLIDTTACYGADAPKQWRARAAKAAEDGMPALLAFQLDRWFSEGFRKSDAAAVDAMVRVFNANELGCYQASCIMLGDADLRGMLREFRRPVSVIVGEEDYATTVEMAQDLHKSVPGSTLNVIRGGRHLTPVQCPKEIAGFIRELARRAA
jgi:3-oxoadipate enol-lactonase